MPPFLHWFIHISPLLTCSEIQLAFYFPRTLKLSNPKTGLSISSLNDLLTARKVSLTEMSLNVCKEKWVAMRLPVRNCQSIKLGTKRCAYKIKKVTFSIIIIMRAISFKIDLKKNERLLTIVINF